MPGTVLRLAILKFAIEFGSYALFIPMLGYAGAAAANVAGAVVSYIAAHVLATRTFPEGAGERARAAWTNLALLGVGIALVLGVEEWLSGAPSLVARLLLVPVGAFAILALGQVNRHDLIKLGSVPVQWTVARHIRDRFVSGADRLARALERRSPA
jgi:hypothetical protein